MFGVGRTRARPSPSPVPLRSTASEPQLTPCSVHDATFTDSYSLPPLPSSATPVSSLLGSRKLRPSRHSRLLSPSALATLLDGATDSGSDVAPGLLANDSLPPSFLSLSVLSHPSLSRTSTSALNSPFGFNANGSSNNNSSNSASNLPPSKKARNQPPSAGAGNSSGGNQNGGKNTPGAAGANGGQGGEERIFLFVAGKSLTDLSKLVKGSEAEVEGDLGEIRRNWRGGGVTGRGRRGAAIKADQLSSSRQS